MTNQNEFIAKRVFKFMRGEIFTTERDWQNLSETQRAKMLALGDDIITHLPEFEPSSGEEKNDPS